MRYDWDQLLRLLPGYDPFATADGSWFDESAASKVLDFFPALLRHVEGATSGKPFVLRPWQQCYFANLLGWKREDEIGRTVRRYRESLLYVPRGNGKTPMIAGLSVYMLLCDGEQGAQNYSTAADREQASHIFKHTKGMIEREPELQKRCKIYGGAGSQQRSVVSLADPLSTFRPLSADAFTKHGMIPHFVANDELHAHPTRDLYDVMKTSMGKLSRAQPLMVSLTTSDFDRPSVCNELRDYAGRVRDGSVSDPTFLPAIYEADEADDWTSDDTWAKANPNLDVTVSRGHLRQLCERAKLLPEEESTFKRLHLNLRTQKANRFIDPALWAGGNGEVPDLTGKTCFAGLDLSSTTDLTALVLVFPRDDGGVWVVPHFWVPGGSAWKRERRDRVPYQAWQERGAVEFTAGDAIDYDLIRRRVNEAAERYDLKALAVDRWNATQLVTQLQGDGINVGLFGQGYRDMTAPCRKMEALLMQRRLIHGGQPVLAWMAANTVAERDAADNVKFAKDKSADRIDGMVALAMALGVWMQAPEKKRSRYETEDSVVHVL